MASARFFMVLAAVAAFMAPHAHAIDPDTYACGDWHHGTAIVGSNHVDVDVDCTKDCYKACNKDDHCIAAVFKENTSIEKCWLYKDVEKLEVNDELEAYMLCEEECAAE